VIGGFATPVLFWLVLGSGIGRSFNAGGAIDGQGGYLQYFYSGALALIVLFTAIFSTISLIQDRQAGFLQGVLVSPVWRSSLVVGKVVGASVLATGQGALFLVLGPFVGLHLTVASVFGLIVLLFVLSVGLSAMGFAVAWMMDSVQGFHSIMNLVLMPMWMLSGAVFPASGASGWLRSVMWLNPMTYGVACVRGVLDSGRMMDAGAPGFGVSVSVTVGFAAVMVLMAWLVVNRTREGA